MMVFIDDGMSEGEPNLQFVCEKNRRFQHGVVQGLVNMPAQYNILAGNGNMGGLKQISSDVDEGSYHRLATGGVQLKRGNTSLHYECIAGL